MRNFQFYFYKRMDLAIAPHERSPPDTGDRNANPDSSFVPLRIRIERSDRDYWHYC